MIPLSWIGFALLPAPSASGGKKVDLKVDPGVLKPVFGTRNSFFSTWKGMVQYKWRFSLSMIMVSPERKPVQNQRNRRVLVAVIG